MKPSTQMMLRIQYLERQLHEAYRVERLLGHGGMGEVWAAHDLQLGIAVAIKVIEEDLSEDPMFAARFDREARTLAKFIHPRIVQVKTAGILTDDRRLFIVMELLRGRTLREILSELHAEGLVLDCARAAFYGWQALEGLGVAHGKGIVHRDVKPDNVMIDADDKLKLLDFGLARGVEATGPQGEGAGKRERLSASSLLGTAWYMAPELIVNRRGDARSDLYSLGVMLAEMLTGERLYQVTGHDEAAVLRAHVEQAPMLRREKNPECPEALWKFTRRLVEKDPERRYQEAVEAREELGAILVAMNLAPSHRVAEKLAEERKEEAVRTAFEAQKEGARRAVAARRDQDRAQTAAESTPAESTPQAPPDPTAPLGVGFVVQSPCAGRTPGDGTERDGGDRVPDPTAPLGVGFVVQSPCAEGTKSVDAPDAATALPARRGRAWAVDVEAERARRGRAWAVDVEAERARRGRVRVVAIDSLRARPGGAASVEVTQAVPVKGAEAKIPAWVAKPRVAVAETKVPGAPPRPIVSRGVSLAVIAMGVVAVWAVLLTAIMAKALLEAAPEGTAMATPTASATTTASAATTSASARPVAHQESR